MIKETEELKKDPFWIKYKELQALDIKIAELMGYKFDKEDNDWIAPFSKEIRLEHLPPHSTRLQTAWCRFQEMQGFKICNEEIRGAYNWFHVYSDDPNFKGIEGYGETAPEAICIAYIKWKELTSPPS